MQSNIIPIVFAANDKYAPYLGVTVHSLIKRASSEYFYRIYVLTDGISESHRARIMALAKDNFSIDFIDVSKLMEQWAIPTVKHLSKETAYRLLVDKLFSSYKKILYLDCDIIILNDISILYNINIGNYIFGASLAFLVKGFADYVEEQLKVPLDGYFNAGVLLINIEKFSSQKIGKKGLDMLAKHSMTYISQDQDVLNLLCRDNVKYIDGRWNVEWQYLTGQGDLVITSSRVNQKDLFKNPYIVHYTSHIKPWNHPEIQKSEYFWQEAKETVFYEEIIFKNAMPASLSAKVSVYDPFEKYSFPWYKVTPRSRIIIYGGGAVGRAYCAQVEKTQYCCILFVCDRAPADIKDLNFPVISPDNLLGINVNQFDLLLIALENEKTAMQVKEYLLEMGVPENKIVWENPIKNMEKE